MKSDLLKQILTDIKVELSDEFDENFKNGGFFGSKWPPRKNTKAMNALLIKTGRLRKSITGSVSGNSVSWKSDAPYANVHNTGGKITQSVPPHSRTSKKGKNYSVKAHSKTMTVPQRKFIGDHPQVGKAVNDIVGRAITKHIETIIQPLFKK